MNTLQEQYSSLSSFSDINWESVSSEYEKVQQHCSFPEYLQIKSEDGDAPPFLHEIAYYQMALSEALVMEWPEQQGISLNPTAIFLNFQFDVEKMLNLAEDGQIEVLERPHVLCIYRDDSDDVCSLELGPEELGLLQALEEGPRPDNSFVNDSERELYEYLVKVGLIHEHPLLASKGPSAP